jgi:hypothetical protein
LNGGDITITASATGADADAYIHNASGDAGDVRVTSTGVSQVHGFDFLAYFDPTINNSVLANNPNRLRQGDSFVVTIGEHTLTYAITANVLTEAQANTLLPLVVNSLNLQAQEAGLNVTFATTFTDGPTPISTGLFAVWDSIREEEIVEVAVKRKNQSEAVEIANNEANADFFWDRESTIDNAAYLEVIAEEGETLKVASVTVTSETEIAFNTDNHDHGAWADFYGNVHVTGDITVSATELNSYAETWMNNPEGTVNPDLYGITTLGLNSVGSNITVTASGQIAGADAQIHNAEGTVGNITVTASGDMIAESVDTNVNETQSFFLFPQLEASLGLVFGSSLDVELTESYKSWSVMLDGVTLSVDLVDIEEMITGGDSNDAYVDVLRATEGLVSALNQQAAEAGLRVTFDTDLVPVSYMSGDSDYSDFMGPVILKMTWNDFKNHDTAVFGITTVNGEFLSIRDMFAEVSESFDVSEIFGPSADFVFGPIYSEDLSENGEYNDTRAEANIDLELDGTVKGNLVVASTNEDALATANLYGDMNFEGNLTVTASDLWSDALLTVNVNEQSTGIDFGRVAGNLTVGSNLSVTASGQASTAKAEILKATGTLGNLAVTSSGAPLVQKVTTPLDAEAEVQTFDMDTFLSWVSDESLDNEDQTWTVTLSGGSFSEDIEVSVSGDWESPQALVDALNSDDDTPAGVVFSWNSEDDTLSITYPEGYDFDLAEFKVQGHEDKEFTWGSADDVFGNDSFDANVSYTEEDGTSGDSESQTFSMVDDFRSSENSLSLESDDIVWSVTIQADWNGDGIISDDETRTLTATGSWGTTSDDAQDIIDDWNACADWNCEDVVAFILSGDSITIDWTDSGDVDMAHFKVEGHEDKEERWAETGSTDVTAFISDDYTEEDGSSSLVLCDFEETPSVSHVELEFDGTVAGNVSILASNVAARATAQVVGDLVIEGDVSVTASSSDSFAWLEIDGDHLTLNGELSVTASGVDSNAGISLSGISNDVDKLTVESTAQNAHASANLKFDDGVMNTVHLNAQHHRSTVDVVLDQADEYTIDLSTRAKPNIGTVTVDGEGHASLTYLVDVYSSTAKDIDLRAINTIDEDENNHWGVVDLDLVAKIDETGRANGQQNMEANLALWPKFIRLEGFNAQRDSINLKLQNETLLGGISNPDQWSFSSDVEEYLVSNVSFDRYGQSNRLDENPADFNSAVLDLIKASTDYFQSLRTQGSPQDHVGYFYREVTFTYKDADLITDPLVRTSVTHSFLVYDFNVDSTGASGVIHLGTSTGLTERNIANRYSIVHTGDSTDVNVSLDDFHAIEHLTVMSAGENFCGDTDFMTDVTYSLNASADVMIDDITVTAFEIRDLSDEVITNDEYVNLNIFADGEDSSLQLRQSNIFVGADRENYSADLEITGAWGTISSLTLEATYGGQVSAIIDNDHNLSSLDTDFDHGLIARDVDVLAAGEDAYAYLDLTIDNFVQNLNIKVLGYGSTVEVEIDQAQYGGTVLISGSNPLLDTDLTCFESADENMVSLTFWDETASRIVIDNTGRTVNQFVDESIEFNLTLNGEDESILDLSDLMSNRLTIEGWTGNDSILYPVELGNTEIPEAFQTFLEFGPKFNNANPSDSLEILLENAIESMSPGVSPEIGRYFYFGSVGDNGYLFYDFDGAGVTGVVEFIGVNDFEPYWIESSSIG